MSLRPAPTRLPPAIDNRSRSSISLGAAFALFCVTLFGYDTPASQAAGGLFDALFGPSVPPAAMSYNGYAPSPSARRDYDGERRSAHNARRHTARHVEVRRQLAERRKAKVASLQRRMANERRAETESRRGAVESVTMARAPIVKVSATSDAFGGASRRAVCVRACDGYYFPALPVARDSDITAQQVSCEKLCPGAQATLFVMPSGSEKIEDARSGRGGETYAQLVARIDPSDARTKSCSCQTEATAAAATTALLGDSTLRPGDTVVTAQGVRIVRRGSHYPFKASDFLSLAETRDAPLSNRSALYAIERALKVPQGRLAVANGDHRRRERKAERL